MKRIVMANSIEKSCMLIISNLQIQQLVFFESCSRPISAAQAGKLLFFKMYNCPSPQYIHILHQYFSNESLCWSIEFSPELWDLWDALMWTACEALATKPLLPEPTVNQTSSDSSPEVPPSWLQLLYDYWHRNVTILLKIWVDFSGTFPPPPGFEPSS